MGKAPVTKACSTRECCLLQLFLIPVYITHGRLPALNKTKPRPLARAFMSTAAGVGSGAGNVPPSLNNDAQPFPSFIFFTDP
jgi:hypothetical protein